MPVKTYPVTALGLLKAVGNHCGGHHALHGSIMSSAELAEVSEGVHYAFLMVELTTFTPEEAVTTWFSNPCLVLWAQQVESDQLFTAVTPFHMELFKNHWEDIVKEMISKGVISETHIGEIVDECHEFEQLLTEVDLPKYIRTTMHCMH